LSSSLATAQNRSHALNALNAYCSSRRVPRFASPSPSKLLASVPVSAPVFAARTTPRTNSRLRG
jgi:hypothetical protein